MSRLLALFRARTPDHRGTLRDLMPHRYLNCTPQAESPLPLRIRNRVFMTLNRTPGGKLNAPHVQRGLDRQSVLILTIGATFAVSGFILNSFVLPGTLRGFPVFFGKSVGIVVSGALTAVPFAIIGATVTFVGIRANARRIAGAIAAEGYCPTCAYPLAEIETAADGCTVCPECGGAWCVSTSDRKTEPASNPAQPPMP